MASLQTAIDAQIYQAAIKKITGVDSNIVYENDMAYIRFDREQQRRLNFWINNQIDKKRNPGKIKVEFEPVVYPIVLTRTAPLIIILLGLGYIFGKR